MADDATIPAGPDADRDDPTLAAALAAIDAAGAAIRPWFRRRLAAETKDDLSPVTRADREAEAAMRAVLQGTFPADGILGEEHGLERGQARRVWVIDPIDGTRAFITGRPSFGTLLALLEDGVPVLGIIDQPVTGERWIGRKGQPTRFSGPFGGEAATRACASLGEAELSATAPAMFDASGRARFGRLEAACRRVYWGGDCYAYGLLALGTIDIVAEQDLKIWDWAALVPVIEGAGGVITDWRGAPLREGAAGDVLAAGDAALHAAAVATLAPAGGAP